MRELALKTLTETTKDLEVAAWLTEALVRSHGLAGLTAGAQVMAGLAEHYWDGLFPLPDDDGMETRVAPVTGLNGRDGNGSLIQPLRKVALFTRRPDGTPVAFYQYQQSEKLSTTAMPTVGSSASRHWTTDARRAPTSAYVRRALFADAWAARDAWQAMANVLDAKAGADGPSTTAVRDLLSADHRHRQALSLRPMPLARGGRRDRRRREAAEAAAPGGAPAAVATAAPGQIASREDALRALGEIANFFRRTEPHSPLSYTLDEAVRRGRMTWPELLAEVVADTEHAQRHPDHPRHPPAAAGGLDMRRTDGGASVKRVTDKGNY